MEATKHRMPVRAFKFDVGSCFRQGSRIYIVRKVTVTSDLVGRLVTTVRLFDQDLYLVPDVVDTFDLTTDQLEAVLPDLEQAVWTLQAEDGRTFGSFTDPAEAHARGDQVITDGLARQIVHVLGWM